MKLHYKSVGEGTPLLILHGLFGSGDNWSTLAKQFAAEGYCAVTIDQRNHGRSPHDPSMNYLLMAEDLQELIDENAWNNPVLLGHSMGGKTIMFHAQHFPEVASKLIIVDIAPRHYPPHHGAVIEALMAVDLSLITTRKEVEVTLRSKLDDEATLQFLLKNLYWNERNKLDWRFNLTAIVQHMDEIGVALPSTPAVHQPSLFVRGEHSNYIRSSDYPQILETFPDSEVVTVAASGHWVHAENPAGFVDAVLRFLGNRP